MRCASAFAGVAHKLTANVSLVPALYLVDVEIHLTATVDRHFGHVVIFARIGGEGFGFAVLVGEVLVGGVDGGFSVMLPSYSILCKQSTR